MPWLHYVGRLSTRCHRSLHRSRTIDGRNTGIDTNSAFYRERKIRLFSLRAIDHRGQIQLLAALFGQSQADQPTRLTRHKGDMLGLTVLARHHHYAFVMTVSIVIEQHYHAPLANVADQFVYAIEFHSYCFHMLVFKLPRKPFSASVSIDKPSPETFAAASPCISRSR